MDTNGRAMDTDRRCSPSEFPIDPPRLHAVLVRRKALDFQLNAAAAVPSSCESWVRKSSSDGCFRLEPDRGPHVLVLGFLRRFDAVGFLRRRVLDPTRSGSLFRPVSRFHSSNVSLEIFPSTRSCANLRRCAWLLKGMMRLTILFRRRRRRIPLLWPTRGSRLWRPADSTVRRRTTLIKEQVL
jgi:hypothetical protein